jgi:hypothetical protein
VPASAPIGPGLRIMQVRTSENSVKAKFVEFFYHEDKRCMLVSLKMDADFSRGCVLSVVRPAFFLTHPTLPFVDRFMPVLSLSKQVSASHRSECLFTAPIGAGYAGWWIWTSENFPSGRFVNRGMKEGRDSSLKPRPCALEFSLG